MAASQEEKSAVKKGSLLRLTPEQEAILQSTGDITINAVAGSGKTTTIIHYAATRPAGSRILYLAYNRSVKMEAKKRFAEHGLGNVRVETAHSLAYRPIVLANNYSVRKQEYKTHEIAALLGLQSHGEKHGEYILANHIQKFIQYFCNSSAQKVQELNYLDLVQDEKALGFVRNFYTHIEHGARLLLSKMYKGEMEITHDFYLKRFQLSNPVLPYDYILFDEGQDASPAMLDIFLKQPATKVIVGDAHQQIYAWRHAVNSLAKTAFANYHLSTSFRFGSEIAGLAATVLSWKNLLHETPPVLINGKGKAPVAKRKATLARSNLGLLVRAITFITEHPEVDKLYFEGNIHSYTYADEGASLYDVLNLYNKKHSAIRDRLIQSMQTIEDLEDYIEKTEDVQLGMMVEVVKEYGNELPSLIKSLKEKHVGDDEKESAEMIFSTVHRAKGMEYDAVQLVEDFITEARLEKLKAEMEEAKKDLPLTRWNEEINLLYVAITRTKGLLRIPEALLPKGFLPSKAIEVLKKDEKAKKAEEEKRNQYKKSYAKHEAEKPDFLQQRLSLKNGSGHSWTAAMDKKLKALYEDGKSIASIAAHFAQPKSVVQSRLRKLGREE